MLVRGRREEHAAHGAVLDQVDDVGGVAVQLARRGAAQLRAQAAPGGGAQPPVGARVGRAQQRGGRLAHRVVHDEPVGGLGHERQRAQALVGAAVVVRQHRREQRARGPAGQRGRVERAPRRRVEPVEVRARQLLADRAGGDLAERQVRPVAQRPGGELQAQRVAVRDQVDAARRGRLDAVAPQQRDRVLRRQVVERDAAQQRPVAAPAVGGHGAPGDHHAHVGGQGGHEGPAQPVVEREQQLGAVDAEHDLVAARGERGGGDLERGRPRLARHRGEEGALRAVEGVRVGVHDLRARGPRVGGERAHQCRLSDTRQAVHVRDDGAAGREQLAQQGALGAPARDLTGAVLQQRSKGPGHGATLRARSRAVNAGGRTGRRVASAPWAGRCSTCSSRSRCRSSWPAA